MKEFWGKWKELIISILIAEGVGALAALLGGDFRSFYQSLRQPALAPPSWVFPVAWTILYALMGFAAWMVWKSGKSDTQKNKALKLYALQLLINFCWTIVFFRFHMIFAAILVILALDLIVAITIGAFGSIRFNAGALLVPYFLWLLFATYLNVGIWILN